MLIKHTKKENFLKHFQQNDQRLYVYKYIKISHNPYLYNKMLSDSIQKCDLSFFTEKFVKRENTVEIWELAKSGRLSSAHTRLTC